MDSTVVWKYEVKPGLTWLDLPAGAEPIHVAAQGEAIVVWVRLTRTAEDERADVSPPTSPRPFLTLMTGEAFYAAHVGPYVGTAHLALPPEPGYPYGIVAHVFEYLP